MYAFACNIAAAIGAGAPGLPGLPGLPAVWIIPSRPEQKLELSDDPGKEQPLSRAWKITKSNGQLHVALHVAHATALLML